jgi:hypothetical protein
MAASRKRRPGASREDKHANPRKPAAKPAAAEDTSVVRRCWLCSEPLAQGVIAPLPGLGSFEVHQRCYDQAMQR